MVRLVWKGKERHGQECWGGSCDGRAGKDWIGKLRSGELWWVLARQDILGKEVI